MIKKDLIVEILGNIHLFCPLHKTFKSESPGSALKTYIVYCIIDSLLMIAHKSERLHANLCNLSSTVCLPLKLFFLSSHSTCNLLTQALSLPARKECSLKLVLLIKIGSLFLLF